MAYTKMLTGPNFPTAIRLDSIIWVFIVKKRLKKLQERKFNNGVKTFA